MPFTKEDKILIKKLFEFKGYNGKHLVREFFRKGWNVSSIYKVLQWLLVTGLVSRQLPDDASSSQSNVISEHD